MDLQTLEQLTRTYENRTIDEYLSAWAEAARTATVDPTANDDTASAAVANTDASPGRSGSDKRKRRKPRPARNLTD